MSIFSFLQDLPKNPPPGFESETIESFRSSRSFISKIPDKSFATRQESFAATLEKICARQKEAEYSKKAIRIESEPNKDKSAGGTECDEIPADETPHDEDQSAKQAASSAELTAFLNLLSMLGFKPYGDELNLSPGRLDLTSVSDESLGDGYDAAALKQLLIRLQQDGLIPSTGIIDFLNRFRQFLANVSAGNISIPTENQAGESVASKQMPDLQAVERLLEKILQGDASQKASLGPQTEDNVSRQTTRGPLQTVPASNPANGENADLEKSSRTNQETGAERSTAPDSSMIEEKMDSPQKTKSSTPTNDQNRPAQLFENEPRTGGAYIQSSSQQKDAMRDSANGDALSINKNALQPLSGQETISKILSDAQIVKETDTKAAAAILDESSPKVTKAEGGNTDSGLLNSHNQAAEKSYETASSSKETEAGNGALRAQTMDQIVKKAVVHLGNGQNEVKIDLKPEYLGQIRMQVLTEHHQVTVKILTEFSYVKDMIETNLQQLRAQLQQQGLDVDVLEVSLSHNPDGFDHAQENADQLKAKDRNGPSEAADNAAEEIRSETRPSAAKSELASAVDYFA